jgi:ABC-2 type transport system ATP-binding protein
MPDIEVNMPSGSTALALLPVALLMLGLVVYSLIHLVRAPAVPYLPKWLWAVLIVVSTPWGALAYLLLSRGTPSGAAPASAGADPLRADAAQVAVATPVASAVMVDRGRQPVVSTRGLTRDYGGGAGLFDVDLRVPHGTVFWSGPTEPVRAHYCRS